MKFLLFDFCVCSNLSHLWTCKAGEAQPLSHTVPKLLKAFFAVQLPKVAKLAVLRALSQLLLAV